MAVRQLCCLNSLASKSRFAFCLWREGLACLKSAGTDVHHNISLKKDDSHNTCSPEKSKNTIIYTIKTSSGHITKN